MIVSSGEVDGICPKLFTTWTGVVDLDILCASVGPSEIDELNECLNSPCHENATCTGNEVRAIFPEPRSANSLIGPPLSADQKNLGPKFE